MSKKNKKSDAPEEEIVADETVAETAGAAETSEPAEKAAENNIAVSEEPANIAPDEVVKADEVNGAEAEDIGSETKIGIVSRPVNFRTGPSFGRAVIAELKAGTKVILMGTEEGDKGKWYKCEFDGRKGYVKATGVTIKG